MKKSVAVVGQIKQRTFAPFICYVMISVLLLPSVAMRSYGRSLERYGGLSMSGILQFFKQGNQRILAIVQTAFFINSWEQMYREAEAQRKNLEFQLTDLQRKLEEMEQLRQLLALSGDIKWQYINAEIVVHSGSSLHNSFVINVGVNRRVRRDAPVIGFSGDSYGLIGKVHTVGQRQSTVVSFVSRYHQLGIVAMLQNSRFHGILNGSGRLYRLNFIDRQALGTLKSGDLVVSAGSSESLYPRGIPIGFVQHVEELEYNASLSLVVRPVIELGQVTYVAVLLGDSPSQNLVRG